MTYLFHSEAEKQKTMRTIAMNTPVRIGEKFDYGWMPRFSVEPAIPEGQFLVIDKEFEESYWLGKSRDESKGVEE